MKTLHYLVTVKVADDEPTPNVSRAVRKAVLLDADYNFGSSRIAVKRAWIESETSFTTHPLKINNGGQL